MISSLIPNRLSTVYGTPWVQMDEAYIVYVIEISAMWCTDCEPNHPVHRVAQVIHVSFTVDVARDKLMNAPPIVAGICVTSDEDIRFLHIETIWELIRQAHAMFTASIKPEHVLSLMEVVYDTPEKEITHVAH